MNRFGNNNLQFLNPSTMPNMINNQFNISLGPSSNTLAAIKIEFLNIYHNPMSNLGISVGLIHENDYTKWYATLTGPRDTPYEKGFFKILISFPNNYPISPPQIFFLTPIYHININPYANQMGIIDPIGFVPIQKLEIWKPQYTMKEVLTFLCGLFYYANPECGYGSDRVMEYKNNKSLYFEKVKHFVKKYAGPSNFQMDWGSMSWNFNIYE